MNKRWIIKPKGNTEDITMLMKLLDVDYPIANLLVQHNIKTFNEAHSFFRPNLTELHDPFKMTDMRAAVERLTYAIEKNEKILIYGDYDVDGITAVAMTYSFLIKRYKNIIYYIPDRHTEGYGISYKGIDFAFENNCKLIIALDCGIKAVEKVKYASQKKIDFIICDHHLQGAELPKTAAVLDPKRHDCSYPFKDLSGCAVGFKFLHAYAKTNNIPFDELMPLLDLVAVSIGSDIVPITGENRILAYFGLQLLNSKPRIGLQAIIKIAGIEGKEITISDIVFKIGPRLNAAGRIELGMNAVELLICEDKEKAMQFARKINEINTIRKDLDANITDSALKMIDNDDPLGERKTTVLFNPDWNKGVIGIVASRLIETYYRPTILLTESNGMITGSARSVEGFDIYQAIESCNDLLETYGGHMFAAGLTLKKDNLALFRERFENAVERTILPEHLTPQIIIDTEIDFIDITPKFFRILKQFGPFGPGNMEPLFVTNNVKLFGQGRLVGNDGEHLKIDVFQEANPDIIFPAIAFQQSKHLELLKKLTPVSICYSIDENSFGGKKTLQLRIRDIKPTLNEYHG